MPYASSMMELVTMVDKFEFECFFDRRWHIIKVRPMLINSIAVFMVYFSDGEAPPMALVYNNKNIWANIENESMEDNSNANMTRAIGSGIEQFYSTRYLPWSPPYLNLHPDPSVWHNAPLN
ncbi:hypothetical protein ACX0G9_06725 [Flavitalea flava]